MTAFARTAAYDSAIANWMGSGEATLPESARLAGVRINALRYGCLLYTSDAADE